MSISDAEYLAWLDDDTAIRNVLIEASCRVSGVETIFRMSIFPYVTHATDTPANTPYLPIVIGNSIQLIESLSLDDNSSLSYGDIEIANGNGEYDDWLNHIWTNRAINCYLGDVRWARADYRPRMSGITEQLGSSARNTLNLVIRGKLQRLNTVVTEKKIGGTTNNKDELVSLLFGECFNVSPRLTNPATLEHQIHDGVMERNIEPRDLGVPVAASTNLSTGKFTLSASPAGQITCSAQGDKYGGVYHNTVSKIVQRLVTGYGQSDSRFTTDDLDTANLAAFDAANPQNVGHYLNSRENLLSLCNYFAQSVGAQLVETRLGKVQLIKIQLPAPGTPFAVDEDLIVKGTLAIEKVLPVRASIKLGYARNFTVQENLQTGIPAAHKDLYAKEWRTVGAENATVKSVYKLSAEPVQRDTALIKESDAQAEANRELALWSVPRKIVAFTGKAPLFEAYLGQGATITYPRFGMDSGVSGMIIGLSPVIASKARVNVRVLI
ncbi:MAG: hypothetical protein KBF68_04205 [Nitrosomonas sp.]|nr:hypothetical protein [Nitrosomonas sp.]